MKFNRYILLVFAGIAIALASFAWQFFNTLRHLPEAYAAWDTGTLLIEYMKTHDDRRPSSWEELLSVLDTEHGKQIPLRGAQAGDMQYANALRERIQIDWTFRPTPNFQTPPVTPVTSDRFKVVWDGCEPNDMIREYLQGRATTRAIRPHSG